MEEYVVDYRAHAQLAHFGGGAPLTPTSTLVFAARAYPDAIAVIDGSRQFTYVELLARSRRLGSALRTRDVAEGDVVALLALNSVETVEAHYGVPMAGAVLNPINFRLDASAIAEILRHGGARVLLVAEELAELASEVLSDLDQTPLLVVIGAGDAMADAIRTLAHAQGSTLHPVGSDEQAGGILITCGTTGFSWQELHAGSAAGSRFFHVACDDTGM